MPETLNLPQLLPSASNFLDEPSPEHARLFLDVLARYDMPYEEVAPGYIRFGSALIRLDTWQVIKVVEEEGVVVRYDGWSSPIVRQRLPVEAALEVYVLFCGHRGQDAHMGCIFPEGTPNSVVERGLKQQREFWSRRRNEGPTS